MKWEYILMIVAGGVFAVMLLICCLIEFRRARASIQDKERLQKAYSEDNLKKMEYDVAFYDKSDMKLDFNSIGDEQVTIDEVLNQGKGNSEEDAQKAVFTHFEDNGIKSIKGRYRPTD